MRLSSRCIEEHETILSLLIKAAKSEEFPIIKKGQHISALTEARTRDLINYIHGKRRENPNFCIPFPDWMERYVKEGKTGFEEHKKRRHNEERTWDFMYGGSLMKEMKIKGSSEFIEALSKQEEKIKEIMIKDLRLGKNNNGGDSETIDKRFEQIRKLFVKESCEPKS